MYKYERLIDEAAEDNLMVKEAYLQGSSGRILNDRIAINKELGTSTEKGCVLTEEMGHHKTTVGDILDQSYPNNQKQEYQARCWAYNRQVGILGIISAFNAGCRNIFEMAEHLEVTEKFLKDALKYYESKYSPFVKIDMYAIWFVPSLVVMKRF